MARAYDGLVAIAERYDPRLLLINAGSAEPRGPFHVTMDSNDVLTVRNTGTEPLEHLLVINIKNGQGTYAALDSLAPGEANTAPKEVSPSMPVGALGRPSAAGLGAAFTCTDRLLGAGEAQALAPAV